MERLSRTVAAPLPTEPLRRRALGRIRGLVDAGAGALLGGGDLPDDVSAPDGVADPPDGADAGNGRFGLRPCRAGQRPAGTRCSGSSPGITGRNWNRPSLPSRSRHGIATICDDRDGRRWPDRDVLAARNDHPRRGPGQSAAIQPGAASGLARWWAVSGATESGTVQRARTEASMDFVFVIDEIASLQAGARRRRRPDGGRPLAALGSRHHRRPAGIHRRSRHRAVPPGHAQAGRAARPAGRSQTRSGSPSTTAVSTG